MFADSAGDWTFPQVVIVGHAGVKVDMDPPAPAPFAVCTYAEFPFIAKDPQGDWVAADLAGTVTTEASFGYVRWARDAKTVSLPAGWKPDFYWATGPARSPGSGVTTCFD